MLRCMYSVYGGKDLGGKRFSEGNSSDREIQRTLMELLNQMDGFDKLGKVIVTVLVTTSE